MADDYAPFGEKILHVPETEMEPEIQPDGVSDDLRWKPVGAIQRSVGNWRGGDGHQLSLWSMTAQVHNPVLAPAVCRIASMFMT